MVQCKSRLIRAIRRDTTAIHSALSPSACAHRLLCGEDVDRNVGEVERILPFIRAILILWLEAILGALLTSLPPASIARRQDRTFVRSALPSECTCIPGMTEISIL